MSVPRIALVVPALEHGGGLPAVGHFLYRVLEESGRYRPEFVSVSMASRDAESVRLCAPSTWMRGATVREGRCEGRPFRHVGAFLTELEFQRYRPRPVLTRLLDDYDLVQIVAGTPCWGLMARDVRAPVALQVATLARVERREILARPRSAYTRWLAMMTRVTSRLDESALECVDAVFVENEWMREHLSERLGAAKVVFAPPGVDTDRFRPAEAETAAEPYILSVGRLADPRKNVGLLFDAYARVRQACPDTPRLLLAGQTGPTASDWARARSLGIEDHVEYRCDVPLDELARLYREARMYVLSSDEEGLGIVILEAMASGIPVVSTDCGGPATSVLEDETGFLVPVGDAASLAAAIERLVRNPQRARRMGRAGRTRAEEHFSLRATGRLFLERYDQLLATPEHGGGHR